MKERMKRDSNWNKNLITARRNIKNYAEIIRQVYEKKRQNKIQELEVQYRKPIKNILNQLYFEQNMSLIKVGKVLGFDRLIIVKLMKENNIQIKSKTWYINSLKGEKHPAYGKTWEEIFGKNKARKLKQLTSVRSRELIIERIRNGRFPFHHTKIEKIMFEEMNKRGFFFTSQYRLKKFVCDFALPNQKIIVECDGDYWHANPGIYNRENFERLGKIQQEKITRDARKDEFLKKNGWIVMRFFETDIKKNVVECVNKIEAKINWRTFEKAGDIWEKKLD